MTLDATHDPARMSWIASANASGTEFPLQNLPLGIFRRKNSAEAPRGGVAIGDRIVDLAAAQRARLFSGDAAAAAEAASGPTLNTLMAMGNGASRALRRALFELLDAAGAARRSSVEPVLVPMTEAELMLPCEIGDFTDFFSSIYHATNAGRSLRPDNPLNVNFKYVPVAYHSRASSVVASGFPVRRPKGQIRPPNAEAPFYAGSRALDCEVELGFWIGTGNRLGQTIPIDQAEDHIFGFCLLNDWSARDIQGWESQPLGPFLGKSFCTTVSPWIVTKDALEPFRCADFERAAGDPAPLPHLKSKREGGFDITVEALISTQRQRQAGAQPMRFALCNAKNGYWTVAQMVAHHASNGCNLRPGDLFGTGTLSGPTPDSLGCLLEATKRGSEPLKLSNGEERRWLEDGDEVIFRAHAAKADHVTIGFGEARGMVMPA
ncbi:MAG TPA: fumarylacetoacetase [Stellaceae bacterium]|nr:fumarylacetoacetase [Stellaceae bacterium]